MNSENLCLQLVYCEMCESACNNDPPLKAFYAVITTAEGGRKGCSQWKLFGRYGYQCTEMANRFVRHQKIFTYHGTRSGEQSGVEKPFSSMSARKQPMPMLGSFIEMLNGCLEEDEKLPRKLRRTAQILFEEIQLNGYEGGYDSVRRYVQRWRNERKILSGDVYIPLTFGHGEAFQFDWSHEWVEMGGAHLKVKVAHLRLCYSWECQPKIDHL